MAVKECGPPQHPGVTKVQENYANEDKRRSQRVALTSLRGCCGGVVCFVPLTSGVWGRPWNSPAAGSPTKPGRGEARRAGSGEPSKAHQEPRSGQCFQSHAGNH